MLLLSLFVCVEQREEWRTKQQREQDSKRERERGNK